LVVIHHEYGGAPIAGGALGGVSQRVIVEKTSSVSNRTWHQYRRAGSVVASSTRSTPEPDAGTSGSSRDEVSADAALRASNARYCALVESVRHAAIIVLSPLGDVVSWTPAAEHLLGYREDEIVGQHVRVFSPPEDQARGVLEQALEQARVGGRADSDGWRVRKNGTRFWAEMRMTPIALPDGEVTGFVTVVMTACTIRLALSGDRQQRRPCRTRLSSGRRCSG
jgi:PAS domain S-box-containing protein